jgi:hypothetical protein
MGSNDARSQAAVSKPGSKPDPNEALKSFRCLTCRQNWDRRWMVSRKPDGDRYASSPS